MKSVTKMTSAEVDVYLCQHVMGGTNCTTYAMIGELSMSDGNPYGYTTNLLGEPVAFMRGGRWVPTRDANQVREVLAKVPESRRVRITLACVKASGTSNLHDEEWFLLTCPPDVVARAIVSALIESEVQK